VTDESTPATPDEATPAEEAVNEASSPEPEAAEASTETPAEADAPVEAPADDAVPAEASGESETPAEAPATEAAPAETAAATEEPAARPAARRTAASKGSPPAPSLGTGRRKGAVARVRLIPGSGQFDLDGRSLEDVFPNRAHRMQITAPLRIADRERDLDVLARLHGGGVSGQAGALRHGIARALIELDPELRGRLKAEGFLTRDSREKERRKYGLKKARKAPQYSKR
jgi:small subunit ribosomal protein S9